jgi:peptidoglycan/xylan/chitin deacetylase (PgdA/CDA1 family)
MGRLLFLAATLAVLVSVFLLNPWLVALAGLAFLTVILAGVMIPRLALFAPVAWRASDAQPLIALTFDDGPGPTSTRKILAILAREKAQATFFVLGTKVDMFPDILAEIVAAGHELGLHGDTHDRWLSLRHPNRIVADLERARDKVASVVGKRPRLFRPPLGHVSPRTAVAARRLGLPLIGWSVRGLDGLARTTAATTVRRVSAGLRPGAIVLLHDAAEQNDREPVSVEALPAILEEIRRRGMTCVSVSRLLGEARFS